MFFVMLEVIQLRNPKSDRHLCISHLTLFVCVCGWRFGTSCHCAIASWVPQTDGASFFLKTCSCPPRDVFTQYTQTFGITPMYVSHLSGHIRQDHKLKVWMCIDTQTLSHTYVSSHERFV